MNLQGSGFVPNNGCLHQYVEKQVVVKPIGYEQKVTGEIKTVLNNTAVIHVKSCRPIDRFVDNEKSHFAVCYLADVEKYLKKEEIAVGK